MYNQKCARETFSSLGQNDEPHELFGADVGEAMVSHIHPEVNHEVQDSLAPQNFVADVRAQHDGRLVLKNVGGKAGPDSQPGGET